MMSLHPHRDRVHWLLLSAALAAVAGVAMRNAIHFGWRVSMREEPPNNPADSDTTWKQAILWTSISGLAVGFARLLARRSAASGWMRVYGRKPPGF